MARSTHFVAALVAAATLIPTTSAANYTLVDSFSGSSFFDTMDFFTAEDPTNGTVTYVNYATAAENRYIGLVSNDLRSAEQLSHSVYIGVDHRAIASSGRNSIRVSSQQSWTHGLLLADIAAAPTGCGTWPALWLVNTGDAWPGSTGEIDLFETVNMAQANSMTLHTSAGCSLTNTDTFQSSSFSGTVTTSNCDVNAPNQAQNAGCSITAPLANASSAHANATATAGPAFNAQGGGVYALLWTSAGITIYFHPRGQIPADIAAGAPDPASWTTSTRPLAAFAGPACDWDAHVANLSLVVDTTLCGDWAGEVWASGGCAAATGVATCEAYVAARPEAFGAAHWLINSIKMFQDGGEETAATAGSTATAGSAAATATAAAAGMRRARRRMEMRAAITSGGGKRRGGSQMLLVCGVVLALWRTGILA
ncbi:hypothetical protein MBLNU459_g7137t1 [Dothideomycetes sp. NU459]